MELRKPDYPVSVRLNDESKRKLDELCAVLDAPKTVVLVMAIDELYRYVTSEGKK